MGEGVVHANMGTTHEMLSNMEEALVHQEKVREKNLEKCLNNDSVHARNSIRSSRLSTFLRSYAPPPLQQLHAMQLAGNLHGEALALQSMAKTLEYMGSISQACETLENVRVCCVECVCD